LIDELTFSPEKKREISLKSLTEVKVQYKIRDVLVEPERKRYNKKWQGHFSV